MGRSSASQRKKLYSSSKGNSTHDVPNQEIVPCFKGT